MRSVHRLGSFLLAASIGAAWAPGCGGGSGGSHFVADDGSDASADDGGAGDDVSFGGDGAGKPCVNLECQQVDCASQGKPETTVTGTVFDPAGRNPLYDVIVYVPNAPIDPFKSGVTCDKCGTLASGSPLVTALTGPDGTFALSKVPAGANIPLVLQIGKWRKKLTIPNVAACAETQLADPKVMRLPARKSEGDMPQIAITTGGCDPFECLLRKIGIDDGEFTTDQGNGRVHVYQGAGGATLAQTTALATTLWAASAITKYDIVINSCECSEYPGEKPQASIDNLIQYADAGGRLFNTHYHYFWIDPSQVGFGGQGQTNPGWATTAHFIPETSGPDGSETIDTSFPKGDAFATWLVNVGASSSKGLLPIAQTRYNVTTPNPPSTRWIYGKNGVGGPALFHYTFNTPVGKPDSQQCGKVLFSDFHVVSSGGAGTFPGECSDPNMSPQEKALEFMLFDLSSCIQKDTDPPKPPPPK